MTTYLNMLIFHSNDDESNLTNLLLTGLQSLPSACSVSLASVIKGVSLPAAGAQSSRAQSPLAPRRIHGVHAPRAQLPLRSPPRARSRFLAPRPAPGAGSNSRRTRVDSRRTRRRGCTGFQRLLPLAAGQRLPPLTAGRWLPPLAGV